MMYLHHNNVSVLPHDFQHVSSWIEFDTVLCGVLRIMCKNCNLILKQIHHFTAVEKHIEGGE